MKELSSSSRLDNVNIKPLLAFVNRILYKDGVSINMDFYNGIPCIEIEKIENRTNPYIAKLIERFSPLSEFDPDFLDSEEDEERLHCEAFVVMLINLFQNKYRQK